MLISARIFCQRFQPGISIYPEEDRLIAQATGLNLCPMEEFKLTRAWGSQSNPIDVLFPRAPVELVPESENRFFERLSGVPMDFSRNAQGKVTGLSMFYRGEMFSYQKVSDEIPKALELPKRPMAIKLDTAHLDACVGHYEFASNAAFPTGMKLTVWREGDHLKQQAFGPPLMPIAIAIYPESDTAFFGAKFYTVQMAFHKNDKGGVTAVVSHVGGLPDSEGKKFKN